MGKRSRGLGKMGGLNNNNASSTSLKTMRERAKRFVGRLEATATTSTTFFKDYADSHSLKKKANKKKKKSTSSTRGRNTHGESGVVEMVTSSPSQNNKESRTVDDVASTSLSPKSSRALLLLRKTGQQISGVARVIQELLPEKEHNIVEVYANLPGGLSTKELVKMARSPTTPLD